MNTRRHPVFVKIITALLAIVMLISMLPVSSVAAWDPPASIKINKGGPTPEFINQWGTHMVTGFYVTNTGELAYCADQEATGPGGGTDYSLNDGGLGNVAYLAGIQRVIQNGYPFNTNYLSDDDARYATQIAIHWLESYYLGGTEGYDYTIRGTTNANGHDGALAFALALYEIGVTGAVVFPAVFIDTPSAWTNAGGVTQCTVPVTQNNTQYWEITALPAGVTSVNGTTFSGNTTLVLQLNDPAAYSASSKQISIQGYCNIDTSNIHVFVAGGGYQNMIVYQQNVSAVGV